MKLEKIELSNYRCFDSLTVDIDPKLTVLIAANGVGKSTILDAIRVSLWTFVSGFDLAKTPFTDPGNSIPIDDVRVIKMLDGKMIRQLPASVKAIGDPGTGDTREWTRIREKETPRSKTIDADKASFVRQFASAIQEQIRDPEKPYLYLPVFGYYGTGRLWAQKKLTEANRGVDDTTKNDFFMRAFAYRNCLDPASSYKHFKEWFTWVHESYFESQIKHLHNKANIAKVEEMHQPLLVVQQAIDTILQPITGWHTLEFSYEHEKSLIMTHPEHGVLKVDQLSDGIRSVLAMVGDIAYRCVKLNPLMGIEAAKKTNGIVLIDEVDMHLHPEWQQVILQQLQQAFPNIQFIVTTHSPQVLSTVKRENIRVLAPNAEGKIVASMPLAKTYGEPSNDVLQSVMHVDPQPPIPEKADLHRLTELVDQGQYQSSEAIALMVSLNAQLDEQHPQLQKLQRSIARQKVLNG